MKTVPKIVSNSRQPLVTIGLPVYNGEKFLAKTIESLLAQEYQNFEIKISDNASEDGTADICHEYAAKDPRITYVRNVTNIGPMRNGSRILDEASGEFIMFAADHDLWAPHFISTLLSELQRDDSIVLAYPRTVMIDENDAVTEIAPDKLDTRGLGRCQRFNKIVWEFTWGNMVYGLFRTAVYRQVWRPFDVISPDHVVMASLSLRGAIAQIDEPLFFRRINRPVESSEEVLKRHIEWFSKSRLESLVPRTIMAYEHVNVVMDSELTEHEKQVLLGDIKVLLPSRFGGEMLAEVYQLVKEGAKVFAGTQGHHLPQYADCLELVKIANICRFFFPELTELNQLTNLCSHFCSISMPPSELSGSIGKNQGQANESKQDERTMSLEVERVHNHITNEKLSTTTEYITAVDFLKPTLAGGIERQRATTNMVVGSPVIIGSGGSRSICFVNTYYSDFLRSFYEKRPYLLNADYQKQIKKLQAACFGDSDFYSAGMEISGWVAGDLIANATVLQATWAYENNFHGEGLCVVVEQIRRIRPDVVYIQDLHLCTKEFLDLIRPYSSLIVGQIASPLPPVTYSEGFDIIFSSFPHFVARFRQAGIISYYQPLAFEPHVLKYTPKYTYDIRPVECSFVGGISRLHSNGYELLEYLAKEVSIHIWGYGVEALPEDSAIRGCHHGEVWGKDMFKILSSSKIAINRHIDVAENYANNMRLFEATGCGALLITDYKDNLNDLFEIGEEVVVYRSREECATLINYYLANPREAEKIAQAGRERTLRDHTYTKRMEQTAEILERHLRYKRENASLQMPDRISDGHQAISRFEVTPTMESAWQDPMIPIRQRALVQHELAEMYRGNIAVPFRVLTDILKPVVTNSTSLLEIGCASGYYYEIIEYLLNKRIDYTGVDYSQPMIDMAKSYYPAAAFFMADGAKLHFADRQFHIVISSCVLLHVPNWRQHVSETVRVADKFIVVSRTPVCKIGPTRYMKKYAYGVETVELLFNEEEIVHEFLLLGLELINTIQYHGDQASDEYQVTYLFRRQ